MLMNELSKVSRIDIVWDIYQPDSLKGTTRERRGTGTRRRVHASTRIPGNWQSFLRNDENKQELFRFLATKCVHYQTADEKEIYSTFEDEVLGSSNSVVSSVVNPCSHEEADTRIFVHVNEIAQRGHSKVMVRTVDTDVVIIAIAHFLDIGLQELWIAFGTGKQFRYVPIVMLCPFSLDMEKSLHDRLGKHTQTLQRCFRGCPQNPVT